MRRRQALLLHIKKIGANDLHFFRQRPFNWPLHRFREGGNVQGSCASSSSAMLMRTPIRSPLRWASVMISSAATSDIRANCRKKLPLIGIWAEIRVDEDAVAGPAWCKL